MQYTPALPFSTLTRAERLEVDPNPKYLTTGLTSPLKGLETESVEKEREEKEVFPLITTLDGPEVLEKERGLFKLFVII